MKFFAVSLTSSLLGILDKLSFDLVSLCKTKGEKPAKRVARAEEGDRWKEDGQNYRITRQHDLARKVDAKDDFLVGPQWRALFISFNSEVQEDAMQRA